MRTAATPILHVAPLASAYARKLAGLFLGLTLSTNLILTPAALAQDSEPSTQQTENPSQSSQTVQANQPATPAIPATTNNNPENDPFNFQAPALQETDPNLVRILGTQALSNPVTPDAQPRVTAIPNSIGMPVTRLHFDLTRSVRQANPDAHAAFPEGSFLVKQRGRIQFAPNKLFTVFQFVDTHAMGQEQAYLAVLQPSRFLELLEDDLNRRKINQELYQITGQIHTYRGLNYLLITQARSVSPETLADNPPSTETAKDASNTQDSNTQADHPQNTQTTSTDSSEPTASAPQSPADVLNQLLNQRTTPPDWADLQDRVPVSPAQNSSSGSGNLGASAGRGSSSASGTPESIYQDGDFILNRRGRLIRAGATGVATFAFEADSQATPEAPIRLYPCQLLQNMENAVIERGDAVVFEVSGQIHLYRGIPYLLPTLARGRPSKIQLDQ